MTPLVFYSVWVLNIQILNAFKRKIVFFQNLLMNFFLLTLKTMSLHSSLSVLLCCWHLLSPQLFPGGTEGKFANSSLLPTTLEVEERNRISSDVSHGRLVCIWVDQDREAATFLQSAGKSLAPNQDPLVNF